MPTQIQDITFDVDVRREIEERAFAWIPAKAWRLAPELEASWERLRGDWDHLEADRYLKDGASFRRRRYGRYRWLPATDVLDCVPVEPYFQPQRKPPAILSCWN
jgi:hypothetical protein